MKDHAVITGTGLVCALGQNLEEVWEALLLGRTGIRRVETLAAAGFPCLFGASAEIRAREETGIAPRLAGLMEKHLSMLFHCSQQALARSHPQGMVVPPEEIGFYAAMGMVDYDVDALLPAVVKSRNAQGSLDYDRFFAQGYQEIYPLYPLAMLNNVAFCQVAIALDIRGENAVFSPHADAGLQAFAEGMATILEQKSRLVLAGGVSETLSPISLSRARLAGILNTWVDSDTAPCRPFAADRQGTVLGEGGGMVTLERESEALARGVRPLARITGFGFSFRSAGETSQSGDNALAGAMQQACANARTSAMEVDLVIAHGDGTVAGDLYEMEALHQIFAKRVGALPVFASKGALGHLLSGSPALDLILATQMLRHQVIPPCPSATPLDPRAGFVMATDQPLVRPIRRIVINACSHEGPCASMVVEALA
jgi:3-oxoacyl-[acyl-carrier-protein] synthase II